MEIIVIFHAVIDRFILLGIAKWGQRCSKLVVLCTQLMIFNFQRCLWRLWISGSYLWAQSQIVTIEHRSKTKPWAQLVVIPISTKINIRNININGKILTLSHKNFRFHFNIKLSQGKTWGISIKVLQNIPKREEANICKWKSKNKMELIYLALMTAQ